MKKILCLVILACTITSYGQSPEIKKFLDLKDNMYFIDRDSAFIDPYYGL